MKKEFKLDKLERNQRIAEIADKVFFKLSCRMNGVGMYEELTFALKEAYKLGRSGRKQLEEEHVIRLLPMPLSESAIN